MNLQRWLKQKFSQDKNTARIGGKLGQVIEGKYIPIIGENPEISNIIFAAKEAQILGPITTKKGFHLIRVDSTQEDQYENFNNVKRKIIDI